MLSIYKFGSQVLREKSEDVTVFDATLKSLVNQMFKTMEKAKGVGLAGPQVGILKRVFVIEIPEENIKMAFINPQITETSVQTVCSVEGCLSIPGIEHEINRPEEVTVTAQNTDGKIFSITAKGLFARAIMHENDHLNGVLFIDYLDNEEKKKMEKKYVKMEKARKKHN